MSLTPTNNVTPPPSPRENEPLRATPTGRSPTTEATVTVIENGPDSGAFLQDLRQASPVANALANDLQNAAGHQGAPLQLRFLGLSNLSDTSYVLRPIPRTPARSAAQPNFHLLAKDLQKRVGAQLHMYSPAPELRVINRLNSALPDANIRAEGPSYQDLKSSLQQLWRNDREKIVPDDIVFHNALIGQIRESVPRANHALFAIVRVVDALPNVDDQTKARYVRDALALSQHYLRPAQDLVQEIMARGD